MPELVLRGLCNDKAGPFNLTLAGGTCVVVMGPSGADKSVFLRMIEDLDPSWGDVLLGGAARAAIAPTEWRRRVVYNAAEPGWWHEGVAAALRHGPGGAGGTARLARGQLR